MLFGTYFLRKKIGHKINLTASLFRCQVEHCLRDYAVSQTPASHLANAIVDVVLEQLVIGGDKASEIERFSSRGY